jgi:hypothetical protein
MWWFTPVISAHRWLRQGHHKFKARLGYIGSSRPTWATQRDLTKRENALLDLALSSKRKVLI